MESAHPDYVPRIPSARTRYMAYMTVMERLLKSELVPEDRRLPHGIYYPPRIFGGAIRDQLLHDFAWDSEKEHGANHNVVPNDIDVYVSSDCVLPLIAFISAHPAVTHTIMAKPHAAYGCEFPVQKVEFVIKGEVDTCVSTYKIAHEISVCVDFVIRDNMDGNPMVDYDVNSLYIDCIGEKAAIKSYADGIVSRSNVFDVCVFNDARKVHAIMQNIENMTATYVGPELNTDMSDDGKKARKSMFKRHVKMLSKGWNVPELPFTIGAPSADCFGVKCPCCMEAVDEKSSKVVMMKCCNTVFCTPQCFLEYVQSELNDRMSFRCPSHHDDSGIHPVAPHWQPKARAKSGKSEA